MRSTALDCAFTIGAWQRLNSNHVQREIIAAAT